MTPSRATLIEAAQGGGQVPAEVRVIERDVLCGAGELARLGLVDPRQRGDVPGVLAADHRVADDAGGADQARAERARRDPGAGRSLKFSAIRPSKSIPAFGSCPSLSVTASPER